MRKNIGTVMTLIVLAAAALYMNWGDIAPQTTAPTTADEPARTLPCASYKEHRKHVDNATAIPRLEDQRTPAYEVTKVIDGDTIKVQKDGEEVTVRFMGMDTPERSTTRTGEIQHYGEEAARYAESLIAQSGWKVRLTYDQTKVDKYGRELAYVWLEDGRLLNAVMVADGYAYSYTSSPKPEYVDLFLALMREARAAELGLWGQCD